MVRGTPYPQNKVTGNLAAPAEWSRAVIIQTAHLQPVKGPCCLHVTFVLPKDRFPPDHPFGTDLDNLLKRFLDALGRTVLSKVAGQDGAVVEIRAKKRKQRGSELTGARFRLVPISKRRPQDRFARIVKE
jgi:hypothetical protein